MARLYALALVMFAAGLPAGAVRAQPITVTVQKTGETIVVDVTAHVAATANHAWAVLTDYDHMAEFVSAVRESRIVSRKGNHLEVAQTGGVKRGFLDFSFSTLRSVELVPESEIRSGLIRGDFKSYEFTTRIAPGPASGSLTIVHHGEYVPHAWVPPIVGPALIERETHKQYADLIAEMLRRQAGEPRSPRPPGGASSP